MLENARRQLLIVAAAIAASILVLAFMKPNYGLDLEGGVSLTYEVNLKEAQKEGIVKLDASEAEISQVMATTIDIISQRIDPSGTREAVVTRRDELGILIELPKLTEAESRTIESQIQSLGRLEFRMVASDQYSANGVSFNVRQERTLLTNWLTANDGEKRTLVAKDPLAINTYDGAQSPALRWYPRLITPKLDDPTVWDDAESRASSDAIAVGAFTDEQWNGGIIPESMTGGEGKPTLVEFLPINMDEEYFTGKDLDPSYSRAGLGNNGKPAIHYRMRTESIDRYAAWSERYKGQRSAIIFNGVVYSAPVFLGKINGPAEISSDTFTQREVDALVRTLNTGSLPVKPIRQSRDEIGATLGDQSIKLGAMSIAIGGAVLLLFVLWYYRMAGIIACLALAMNILMVLAVVVFLRATLTLPGLAGLVLTMGMAIDSNILIYERIREELDRGKEMLQACRAGFERAIATILDANLTTFIAGLVLFQVGVGPVRGFAVTLMVGIATTLFTAYFVTRLLFHFMLERKALGSLRFNAWFKNPQFDFMGKRRLWIALSAVFIAFGLIEFFATSPDSKYAIDFTGGADLKVVLKEDRTAQEVRDLLANDAEMKGRFPSPIVNTVGETTADGRARKFLIRVKLTDALRAEIDAARAAQGVDYKTPYYLALQRSLKDLLVPDAYSDANVFPNPDGSAGIAELQLHFAEPVSLDSLRTAVAPISTEVAVRNLDEEAAAMGENFKLDWVVPKETQPNDLLGLVQSRLTNLVGPGGTAVSLSNPIPESSEIGGRMVGELRNAAISALVIAMFAIVMYIRIRFREFKYGIAAVASLIHDILVTLGFVVLFNSYGLVDAEIDLAMIAAFLTIIGYSINDTIVIFDRVRENLSDAARLGTKVDRVELLNHSINQTLSRTVLTTMTTMFVIVAQFVVNFHAGTALEGFSFALLVGMLSGTYSTIFIASPLVLFLWQREQATSPPGETSSALASAAPQPSA